MSSAGRAASLSGCVARPRGRETGLTGCAEQIQCSLPTGGSAMETAEHREPYESRGSRTDLGAPGGETPPGDSTGRAVPNATLSDREGSLIGIGGHLAVPPLPHHRAYGSVPRRFDRVKLGQRDRVGGDRGSRNRGYAGPVGPPGVLT